MSERGPIFLGGLSHSGKTQLRIVLGAHPDLAMTRGSSLWDRYHGRFGDLRVPRNLDRCLRALVADAAVAPLGPDADRLRRELPTGPVTYARLFGLIHRHHAERLGKRRWGDQLRGVERFADPIFDAFPAARMIHLIRDPRSGTLAAGRRPGAIGWSTARWIASAELAERNRRRYPDGYRVVRYESLVASPAETIGELCGFVGEAFLPTMERALASIRFAPTRPVAAASVRAFVDRHARRDLTRLQYPLDQPASGGGARPRFGHAVERASMAAWRLFEGRSELRAVRS